MNKKFSLILMICSALCGGFSWLVLSRMIIQEFDPKLTQVAYDYLRDGVLFSGMVYSRHNNGRFAHRFMVWRGKKIGTELLWYDSGRLMGERPHKNGLPHGAWKMWYEDGKVKSLRTYMNGTIEGESWGWHPNGQISDFNLYEHGKEITHKSWIADGTPYYNYVYQDGHKVGIRGGDYCKRLQKLAP